MLKDHLHSAHLGPVIDRMRYGFRLDYERALSTILDKNPHHDVRGLACLILGQYLHDKLRMARLLEDRPELEECYRIVFGENYSDRLAALQNSDTTVARIEDLFERAAEEFADVEFRNDTVGDWAASELYEIRHLGIGRPAPEIAGKDQDGIEFKLSDYRGKVVLLYFWNEY